MTLDMSCMRAQVHAMLECTTPLPAALSLMANPVSRGVRINLRQQVHVLASTCGARGGCSGYLRICVSLLCLARQRFKLLQCSHERTVPRTCMRTPVESFLSHAAAECERRSAQFTRPRAYESCRQLWYHYAWTVDGSMRSHTGHTCTRVHMHSEAHIRVHRAARTTQQ